MHRAGSRRGREFGDLCPPAIDRQHDAVDDGRLRSDRFCVWHDFQVRDLVIERDTQIVAAICRMNVPLTANLAQR